MKTTLLFLLLLTPLFLHAQRPFTQEQLYRRRYLDDLGLKIGARALVYRPDMELHLGDTLPETSLLMANYQGIYLNTQELRGKFVILCFWNTYCSTCLEAFERMKVLQRRYTDKLVVLPVTFEVHESIEWFLERREQMGKKMVFPSAVEDTTLRKFFPHYGDPHDVWIDDRGVIKAIGGPDIFTDATLKKFFSGDAIPSNPAHYPFNPSHSSRSRTSKE